MVSYLVSISASFNLFFETETFATILIAHRTSCDDSCISRPSIA